MIESGNRARADRHERLLVLLLRLGGGFTAVAFLAIVLPADWMAATHRWLGMGELPEAPVVDYLARSIAALYGFHGVLLLLISRDPRRYRTIVRYAGTMALGFGVLMMPIDAYAGMPMWWTLAEGPPLAAYGIVVLYLSRALGKEV